jgi:hypothetical protein
VRFALMLSSLNMKCNAGTARFLPCPFRQGLLIVLLIFVPLLAACTQREEITSYRVRKPEMVDPTLVSTGSTPPQPLSDQQTLGLIVPLGETGWFFKLTGDAKAVEPQHEVFLEFVQSIKFSPPDSKPSWTLPSGWKELPGREMRFATIQIAAERKPLELSVIPLPSGGQDQQKYVLDNVNRWRQQLNLPAISASDLANTTKTLKVDGHEATLVSLVGKGSGQMGGAPFAPFAGGSKGSLPADHPPVSSANSSASATASTTSGDLKYEAPSEWTPGKPNAFSLAAFKVVEGDKQVEITVSTAGGDLLANVNRWRGQVKLPPIDATELSKVATKIGTLGSTGDYVAIVGPDSANRETILGVQADAGGRTWFVKLKGDSELAAREKPRFESFVKSLYLK